MECSWCPALRDPRYGWWASIYTDKDPCTVICPSCYKKHREGEKKGVDPIIN